MAEFGSGEQSLLRALREAEEPSELDRDRVARRLEAELSVALGGVALGTVALGTGALTASTVTAKAAAGAVASSGAATSLAGAAASATSPGVLAWASVGALKWGLLAVALGAAGVGVVHFASRAQNERAASVDTPRLVAQPPGARIAAAPSTAGPVTSAPVTAEPLAAAASVPPPSGVHEELAAAQPVETTKASPAASPPPKKIAVASDLEAELALITDAQSALAAGSPQRALSALSEHSRRFPSGTLVVERDALSSIALCQSGQVSQGAAQAHRFAAKHAASPLLARVRKACGTD